MESLSQENYNCRMVQMGHVESSMVNILEGMKNVEIHNSASVEETLKYCQLAKAFFIPDMVAQKDYSPFLPSKFVYRIMDPQPIVVYSKKASDMHDYAVEYPEAGIFWAEEGNIESLKRAVKDAFECDIEKIDRTRIREWFSEQTIARNFTKTVADT